MSRALTPRAAALEQRLVALRGDPAARRALDNRVSEIQRERAAKLKWMPIDAEASKVRMSKSVAPAPVPTDSVASSPGLRPGSSLSQPQATRSWSALPASPARAASAIGDRRRDPWSAMSVPMTVKDPVGGWKKYHAPHATIHAPLKYGFESEGQRRSDASRVMTPLASSEPHPAPKVVPEVELVHSTLPGTLRTGPAGGGRSSCEPRAYWQPASRQPAWSRTMVNNDNTPQRLPPEVADGELTAKRAAARACRPSSPRQPALHITKQNTRHFMSIKHAHQLAASRPLTALHMSGLQLGCELDLIALPEHELRAQRAVLSTQLSTASEGVKRWLQG